MEEEKLAYRLWSHHLDIYLLLEVSIACESWVQ